jgi:hypothetical protein
MAKDPSPDRAHGSPGSSHQDAQAKPEADERHDPEPRQRRRPDRSRVSGGGGERDKHHTHDPHTKS